MLAMTEPSESNRNDIGFGTRLDPPVLDALKKYIASRVLKTSNKSVVQAGILMYLQSEGFRHVAVDEFRSKVSGETSSLPPHAGRPVTSGMSDPVDLRSGVNNPFFPDRHVALPISPLKDVTVPFAGTISAGNPVEVFDPGQNEIFNFGDHFGKEGQFAYRVKGDSMIDARIRAGDIIIVRENPEAKSGEDVVAVVDGELTIKKLLARSREKILLPQNKEREGEYKQLRLDESRGDRILGTHLATIILKKK
ncbi:LexA family protein [Fimbriiglobus ruber]|uniref:LexA family protein n=1 Tax=Fimbriiglobus ruber TaxID=1908690 RepID=UPI000B4AD545|nr:S24 family peptidase [Fimbriiglobus ruber]